MSKQRLINANEAEEIIWARSEEIRDSEPELSGALAGAIGFLDRCKTVDAVPVVHGEWIKPVDEYGDRLRYECSKCGGHPLLAGDESDELSKYCPYCGAKMDGDKHE